MARGINMPALVASIAGARAAPRHGVEITGLTDVSAAAWLAWGQKRPLCKKGVVDFELGPDQALPRYFALAMEVFERRAGWRVVMMTKPGRVRVYRLRWLGWGTQRRRVRG